MYLASYPFAATSGRLKINCHNQLDVADFWIGSEKIWRG